MRRRKFSNARGAVDMNDRVQVKVIRKRLKLSDGELSEIVRKTGNSIAAISKEAGSRQRLTLPSNVPPAEVIAAVKEPELVIAEQVVTQP
jgi:hypothetical protein